jgi:hypothetical protein
MVIMLITTILAAMAMMLVMMLVNITVTLTIKAEGKSHELIEGNRMEVHKIRVAPSLLIRWTLGSNSISVALWISFCGRHTRLLQF